jgi:hypothetical protein
MGEVLLPVQEGDKAVLFDPVQPDRRQSGEKLCNVFVCVWIEN